MKPSSEPERTSFSEEPPRMTPDEVMRTVIAEFIPGRGYLASLAVVAAIFFVVTILLWNRVKDGLYLDEKYILTRPLTAADGSPAGFSLENIHVRYWTPEGVMPPDELPAWMTRDIREYVLADMQRSEPRKVYSIREGKLIPDFLVALENHPWVQRVIRVEKFYPARLEIIVEYRKPVVMAQICDPATGAETGFLPLDEDARILPGNEIPPELLRMYPQLVDCHSRPLSFSPAAIWDDPKVADAAKIVAEFGDDWQRLDLSLIRPVITDEVGLRREIHYTLETKNGSKIDFGKRISTKNTRDKVKKMLDYVRRNGTLDVPEGEQLEFR